MLDFILSQKESFDLEMGYWKEKLLDVIPLNLGIDFTGSTSSEANKAAIEFLIEKEISVPLNSLSKEHNVSLFITLLSVFKVLLYRYSNQEDICVGNIITYKSANPPDYFVNLVALRDNLNGEDKFPDLLKRVNNTTLEAYNHQKTPFEIVVNNLVKNADVVINPLFQVMFLLSNETDAPQPDILSQQTGKYDLAFILNRAPSGYVSIKIEYTTGLYQK
ncbi:MAG: condensation domain-containing protein, partial [Mucilaginibacter sp.]